MKCVRPAPKDLMSYFRMIEFRKVKKDRTIKLNGTTFEVPVELIDLRVELKFHKEFPEEVEIFLDGRSFGMAELLDRNVNFKIGRNYKISSELKEKDIKSGELFKGKKIMNYTEYFGMKKEPFTNEILTKDLMQMPGTLGVKQRMDYVLRKGGVMAITGDVGNGKSTSLRWSLDQYHKSELECLYITATSGSSSELYKQICWVLKLNIKYGSKVSLIKELKKAIEEYINQKKGKLAIVIDEASLLRTDVFSELHTITQFDYDSSNLFSLILIGQNSLLDKLSYRTSAPLASRIITRAHLVSLDREQMSDYLKHHLKVAGIKANLFSENAITAIHQGSGGGLRQANSLSAGSLLSCMIDKENQVSDEHVRKAATELI
jgi:type II secretory pathway predicted ATPase ExeA